MLDSARAVTLGKKPIRLRLAAGIVLVFTAFYLFPCIRTARSENIAPTPAPKQAQAPVASPTESKVALSPAEKAWLKAHPVITVFEDPSWPPIEFTENGELRGIAEEYMKIIEKRLGIRFTRIQNLSWQEAYPRFQRWEIDMSSSVSVSPERSKFWYFTRPYLRAPIVILTRLDVNFVHRLDELAGRKVAVVSGYMSEESVARDHPGIRLVRVKTVKEGIDLLQRNQVFALIDNMLVINYVCAKNRIFNVKISGETPYVNAQCIGVRKDWAPLVPILQKALDSVTGQERDAIYMKWVPMKFDLGTDYAMLWKVLAIFAVVVAGLGYWIHRLRHEIRRRQEAEAQKAALEEELRQSQKMEAIGRLASGVAHDFNNLLGGILGYAELIQGRVMPKTEVAEYADGIVAECLKAAGLVRQLLHFARKAPAQLRPIRVNELVEQVMGMLRRTSDRRIEIAMALQPSLPMISGDRVMIENAILNVAVNARDAMPDGGRLTVATQAWEAMPDGTIGPCVQVSVADTGVGMSEETKRHVFEPFYTTKGIGQGTGLGLASVYGCITQHGGVITVESKPGAGTRFDIYLPADPGALPEAAPPPAAAQPVPGRGKLLLVDDEIAYHDIFSLQMRDLGYAVHACANGAEAVAYYRENSAAVDVVIMDMNMPKMNGVTCFRRLKEINPQVRVIIASGYGELADRAALEQEGVRFFLQKPYRLEELTEMLRRCLGES